AGALFREEVAPERIWPPAYIIVLTALAFAATVGFAVLGSDSRTTAMYFLGAVAGVFAVFLLIGTLVSWGARRIPRPKSAELRLALGNIGAPGGLTRSIILSLGAGLSLL